MNDLNKWVHTLSSAQPNDETLMTQTVLELDDQALEGLVARVTEAKEHGLALSADDTQLLLDALMTLASLQARLSDKDVTLHKLRKLLGIVQSSEKLSGLLASAGQENTSKKKPSSKNKSRKKRNKPAAQTVKPQVEHHKLVDLKKGDTCPECPKGKLYKYEPARLLRVTGSTAFTPVQHLSERLRCNACGAFFTAELPEYVKADGGGEQKYGYSARSIMGINKYFAGSPFYRQESLQDLLGMPISASTVFDQCEYLSNDIYPIFKHFKKLAKDAIHFHIDDTGNRILDQKPIKKKRRNSDKEQLRTGIYSSGMIARLNDGHELILFNTGIGHAGEFLDDILKQRSPDQALPLVMSDALSSNHVTSEPFTKSLCNSHARRQFVDVLSHFPDEVEWVLEQYQLIWVHDVATQEKGMMLPERLAYHRQHSLPVMESIRAWGQEKLDSDTVERNSGLGKAIRYFDKHFNGLTGFCTQEGARLDNNMMEQQIKLIVRNRKNASFFKSSIGAEVGDVITSIIATVSRAGVNLFHYLNTLQRNADSVKANPESWLPWCYEKMLKN